MSTHNAAVHARRRAWFLGGWLLAVIGLWLLLNPTAGLRAQSEPTPTATLPPGATEYRVRPGDSWLGLANRFGVPVRELQAANPGAVRWNRWLLVGERLIIPAPGTTATTPVTMTIVPTATLGVTPTASEPITVATVTPEATLAPTVTADVTATTALTAAAAITATSPITPTAPQTYTVQPGEGWGVIAVKFGLTMRELMAANPRAIRAGYVLYRGERLLIPVPGVPTPTRTPTATPTALPTESPTPTATMEPTEPAATPTVATTAPLTATDTVTASTTITEGAVVPGCPTAFVDYPETLLAQLNAAAGLAGLTDYLAECAVQTEEGIRTEDWTGDGTDDVVVVYANPISVTVIPQTELIIFNSSPDGYTEGYRAKAAGTVTLLTTEDLNADGQPDVGWVDRTCGASTCFDTVEIVSWDGAGWRDWTEGAITMAYAGIEVAEAAPEGQGQEIRLSGGVYGSVGAGPQRSRVETWGSVGGAPYTLLSKVYSPSNCLYHTVLDANDALLAANADGFAQAEVLYSKAATDQRLEACWTRADELGELRSFSLFRLAVTAAYQGKPAVAADVIASLSNTYPDTIYDQVGQRWLAAYQTGNDIGAACSAANQFATDNPAVVELLADYGYANPTFDAGDVCPVLDVETSAEAAASASQPLTNTAPLTSTVPLTTTATNGGIPACPTDLAGYPTALSELLTVVGADSSALEAWLRECEAMHDERGGLALVDANGDGVEDAIFWPTVVSDLGFGPDGAQGDLLIYHGADDGTFTLAADEEIYGQPTLLANEDLNGDGALDLAWQVIGCSTFCVLEVQIVTWDGADYTSIIQPGATIAEGVAAFEPVLPGDPGQGKQLVLTGGVSGTPEGGLAVPHTEIWQSVESAPFQRIRWTYDRTVEGNDCLGLRLIEGDVALQAGPVLGYQTAVDLYAASIDPTLQACSIFGMQAEEELMLLQGLVSFRLIQAAAFNADLPAARTYLEALTAGQPESDYTNAATQWLARYEQRQNATAACESVQAIFSENTALWQITDHFGYNHPALAAEQICYAPE